MFGYTAFATQTSKRLGKDELRGDGTSGLYRLGRQNITANSETITIETRDRFKSEVIIETRQLSRFVDYDIDYTAGTLYFKQPVNSKDVNLNPIYIRAEYESDDQRDQLTTFGGRASTRPVEGVEIGATYVQQGKAGKDDQLAGVDAKLALGEKIELVGEVAQNRTQTAKTNGYKAEARYNGEKVSASSYIRQVDDNFGLGQVTGSENATRKIGAQSQLRVTDQTSIQAEVFRQDALATGARRDSGSVQATHDMSKGSLRAGVRSSRDRDGAGTELTSNQLTTGVTARVIDRLSVRVDREQSIGKNESTDYPTRTITGADYQLTSRTLLSATQEWTQGAEESTQSTRFGVRTQPWSGGQLATNYEQKSGEGGFRSFANVGLQQQWQATETLSFLMGLDRTHTIRHPGATPLNLNVPLASGGDDFTAYSLGMNYHPESWGFDNRIEYRTSASQQKWNLTSGIQGSLMDHLSTQFTLQLSRNNQLLANNVSTKASSSLGMAWRPDYDGWMFMDRFQVVYSDLNSTATNVSSWRYINNLAANWQALNSLQIALNYGAKLTRENIDQVAYSGFTDLIGLQATYDINQYWDISLQGGVLHSWNLNQYNPTVGFSVGYNIFNNAWVGIGYNFLGYYDQDFAASEFTRQGPFVRIRFKFDQNSLPNLLKENR